MNWTHAARLAPAGLAVVASILAVPRATTAQMPFECTVAHQSYVEGQGPQAGEPRAIDDLLPEAIPRMRAIVDSVAGSVAEDAGVPKDSLATVVSMLSSMLSDATVLEELNLVGEEFTVEGYSGRILSDRIKNFGRGASGTEQEGEPQILDNWIGPYIAVTIRDEYNVGMGEVEYLRIDDDSWPAPFVFVSGDSGILTGTCVRPDGPYEEYYDNGQLYIRTSLLDGVQTGPWESYYRNGQLGRKGTLNEEGHWTGPYEEYDENGQLIEQGSYGTARTGRPRKCGLWLERRYTEDSPSRVRNYVPYPPCQN